MLTPLEIGSHRVAFPVVLAPMAGVTDKPFRQLCRTFGAGYAVSEMLTSNPELWNTRKSLQRMNFDGESGLLAVQIAGSEPQQLAEAAKYNVDNGAALIDINMGCPAKKVCRRWAGSALLQDELLVGQILESVVAAVQVPVTLKIRTGWHKEHVNGVAIARIAEQSGIRMLSVHGRTRDLLYKGAAEYDTIARIKADVDIPVFANGDIDCPEKAQSVLNHTGADGLMIGRGAQGRPWIFAQIREFLATGRYVEPEIPITRQVMLGHVAQIHDFYGAHHGVRIARKHLRWYLQRFESADSSALRVLMTENSAERQLESAGRFFDQFASRVAMSTASIQCSTGTSVPLARCS